MRFQKGFTLIEVMLSILILAIVMIGGAAFFTYGSSQLRMSKHSRLALELAGEQIENLRAVGFSGLADETENGLPLGDFTATRQTNVVGIDENGDGIVDYKKVTVTVAWMEGSTPEAVNLVTLITSR